MSPTHKDYIYEEILVNKKRSVFTVREFSVCVSSY